MRPALHESMLANARRLADAGKFKDARAIIGEVLRTRPEHPDALALAWSIAEQTLSYPDAVALFERAVRAAPDVPGLHFVLALALFSAGRIADALGPVGRAIELAPGEAKNMMLRGRILLAQGKDDEGFESMRKATELEPRVARLWYNYGGLLLHNGRHDEGAKALRRAAELDPDNPLVLSELGTAVLRTGSAAEALEIITRAHTMRPQSARTAATLGKTLVEIGRGTEGVAMLERAVQLDPADREIRQLYVVNINYVSTDGAAMRAAHRAFGERMEAAASVLPRVRTGLDPERRLRVGFLSGDMRRHSCSHFLLPLFHALDRTQFEVWGIATTNQADEITPRFKSAADGWMSVAQVPYTPAAEAIRKAGIDVLIECSGHTDGSRLDICAARPAPVQMTFLGYPNTTGVRRVDYRLVDAITDPPGVADGYCEEKLLRVPGCLWCFRPAHDAPEPGPAPCMASGKVTLGCFNNLSKFSDAAVGAWAEILKRLPDSTLLLKNTRVADPHTLAIFRSRIEALGVAGERIVAVPYTRSTADHLRIYERIDFQLDTFPYNGTTTTCESLWQGVPVLAVQGGVHAAKVSESLLNAVGLDEWIAPDIGGFVARAIELARDTRRLAALRAELRQRMAASPLRDESGYAQRFGGVLREAWRHACTTGAI